MLDKPKHTDEDLLQLLQSNSETAIDLIFRAYFEEICRAVYRIIPDTNLVEDLAQDVFFELWKKRETLVIKTSIRAYLRRAARNKALNYIRDQKIKFEEEEKAPNLKSTEPDAQKVLEIEELQEKIDAAIDSLPERCRVVFTLSRFENMSYQEIADALSISIKTVENQISKALKLLRNALYNF